MFTGAGEHDGSDYTEMLYGGKKTDEITWEVLSKRKTG